MQIPMLQHRVACMQELQCAVWSVFAALEVIKKGFTYTEVHISTTPILPTCTETHAHNTHTYVLPYTEKNLFCQY